MNRINSDLNSTHNISRIWKEINKSGKLDGADDAILFYSIKNLNHRLKLLKTAFRNFNSFHTVAIKTNPHPYILKKIYELGFGLEAASLQEVVIATQTGIAPNKIIYNSPVKTKKEIQYASDELPGLILNVNCFEELTRIPKKNNFTLGLRINPLVSSETSNLYDVSGKNSKFGVQINSKKLIKEAVKNYSISHLHLHVGSQENSLKKPIEAIKKVVELAKFINKSPGQKIETINIGGGLTSGRNNSESHDLMRNYVQLIEENVPELYTEFRIITEFGQWVHEHQGVAFSKVEYIRTFEHKSVAYVHIGADLFVRQTYAPDKELSFVCLDSEGNLKTGKEVNYDIAGPLCFNGDYLKKNTNLPNMEEGDLIAIMPCGANSFGLWSRHCSRNIPALFVDQVKSLEVYKASRSWNPFIQYEEI